MKPPPQSPIRVVEVQLCAFGDPTRMFSLALAGPFSPSIPEHPQNGAVGSGFFSWAEDALPNICERISPGFGCDFHGAKNRKFPHGSSQVASFSCFEPESSDRASAVRLAPLALARLAQKWARVLGLPEGDELPSGAAIFESSVELEDLEPLGRSFLLPPPGFMISMGGLESFKIHARLPSTAQASMELSGAALAWSEKTALARAAKDAPPRAPSPRL